MASDCVISRLISKISQCEVHLLRVMNPVDFRVDSGTIVTGTAFTDKPAIQIGHLPL